MELKKPEFIMFDYGQTLLKESNLFDHAAGFDRLLRYASSNPHGVTGRELADAAERLNDELGRFNPATRHQRLTEMPEESFNRLLFTRFGVKFPPECDLRSLETEYWDCAVPCQPCDGIGGLLTYLRSRGIRTGVVSNLSFCGEALRRRIYSRIPEADFDFVISTCDYLFRKPSPHIFEAALAMAGVPADRVWFCGDQYVADVQGALAAGMMPVWYKAFLRYDGECKLTEGLEIYDWSELTEILRGLE